MSLHQIAEELRGSIQKTYTGHIDTIIATFTTDLANAVNEKLEHIPVSPFKDSITEELLRRRSEHTKLTTFFGWIYFVCLLFILILGDPSENTTPVIWIPAFAGYIATIPITLSLVRCLSRRQFKDSSYLPELALTQIAALLSLLIGIAVLFDSGGRSIDLQQLLGLTLSIWAANLLVFVLVPLRSQYKKVVVFVQNREKKILEIISGGLWLVNDFATNQGNIMINSGGKSGFMLHGKEVEIGRAFLTKITYKALGFNAELLKSKFPRYYE